VDAGHLLSGKPQMTHQARQSKEGRRMRKLPLVIGAVVLAWHRLYGRARLNVGPTDP